MTRHQTSRSKSNNGFRNILPLLLLVLTICSTNSLALPSRNGVLERIRGGVKVNGRGHQVHFNLPIEQQQTTPSSIPSTSNSFFSSLFNPKNEKSKQKKREINPQSQPESDSHPLSKRSRSGKSRQQNRFGSSWSSKSRNNRLIPSNSNHRQSTFLLKKDTNSSKKAATCKSNKANVASSSSTGNSASSSSSSNASSSSSATSPKTTSSSSGSGSTSSQGKVGNTKSGNGMIMAGYWPEVSWWKETRIRRNAAEA